MIFKLLLLGLLMVTSAERLAQLYADAEVDSVPVGTRTSTRQTTTSSPTRTTSSAPSGQYGTAYTPTKDSLSAEQITQYAYNAGFRGDALVNAVAIAMAESGGNPGAHNPNGEDSRGLWQINVDPNTSWGRQRLAQYGNLWDPAISAKAAFDISQGGKNFNPWTVYAGSTQGGRDNPYSRFLQSAQTAARQVTGDDSISLPSPNSFSATQQGIAGSQGGGVDPRQSAAWNSMLQQLSTSNPNAFNPMGSSPFQPVSDKIFSTLASYDGQQEQRAQQLSGDQMNNMPFFDPMFSLLQRQLAMDTEQGVADLDLQQNRLEEDANLFRPYLERRFSQQANRTAEGNAGRGFHGQGSGIMRQSMGKLGADQAYTMGQFERGTARGQDDIQRAIARLTGGNVIQGAEGAREGAGRAGNASFPSWRGSF